MLNKTATWNDMKDRVQCQICFTYQRPGEASCPFGRMVQGITEEVKQLAEERISSRFIMYVLRIHDLTLKNTQRGRRYGHRCRITKKNSRKQDITWVPRRNIIAERSRNATSRTSNTKGACTNKDTHRPIWNVHWKGRNTEPLLKNGVTTETKYKVVQHNQGGDSNPVRDQRAP